ncbi:hypothetical protein BFF78_20495 [Streptomyces fodineus]|uniref:N-acetyltransferase domain-containing protein n=1 Tax=Streptomyces fodineus TaxID=1904616 RepID=A0A1D7YBX1_9ACTN|nr:hypothetical protein [Streptomyces fodineus]AOR33125.1 hypothetical protein BFF78_20495 [Streptomyces fodineus]
MTAHVLLPTTLALPAFRPARGGPHTRMPRPSKAGRRPSPQVAERVRPLTRGQVADRLQELGDLYAETSGGDPWAWNQARAAFLRHLAADARRPGFSLLIAETTALTGYAYGFPVGGTGPWWAGFDGHARGSLLRRAASGRLFVVSGIVVAPGVRRECQDQVWNLARRLQRRLLADDGAALGVTLVDARDDRTVETMRSWGWRYAGADTLPAVPPGPFRVLVLTPGT